MYYKDDFYKEFRTEKELCEYLEEIDSRAEWIRITSKKLKVAAAGEETCTEVPGISLEALEKDTLSHSRLVLILPERICYMGNSAIKSLKGRARIDGKALADVDKKTLAEILNKCLKVARGRALIRFCEGKIRAVLSGDEKDYAIISMPDMYMVTSAYIHGDYEKATFLNGYADHYSVTASWQLEDTKLTDVYKELMQNYGRKTDKDIKAVVRSLRQTLVCPERIFLFPAGADKKCDPWQPEGLRTKTVKGGRFHGKHRVDLRLLPGSLKRGHAAVCYLDRASGKCHGRDHEAGGIWKKTACRNRGAV